jgi:alpha-1,6-mannosyltransferase
MALDSFLPIPTPVADRVQKRHKLGIFLFVLAGVIFRSEVALLLVIQLLYLLILPRMSLQQMIPAGLESAVVALAISLPIDSFFWQKPLWPELWGFYYNAIQGKSADWGTSPYAYYFSSLLPRLLLNPLIMILLIPLSFLVPTIQRQARDLTTPSFLFIAIYSLQPHKESRFIIYVVPPLTAAASLAASYLWTRRRRSFICFLGALAVILFILASFAGSTLMLLISSLNYPGGEAITSVKHIIANNRGQEAHSNWEPTYVHMDVLSCMTGVTRFQQISSHQPSWNLQEIPMINGIPTTIVFDKEEDEETLLQPAFWEKFDYALMGLPGKAIGKWEVVDTIYAYAGMEYLRPGQGVSSGEHMENIYAANNMSKDEGVLDSEDVQEAVHDQADLGSGVGLKSFGDIGSRLLDGTLSRHGIYLLVKDAVRLVTGGYWLGPRMEPAIRILKRVKDPAT